MGLPGPKKAIQTIRADDNVGPYPSSIKTEELPPFGPSPLPPLQIRELVLIIVVGHNQCQMGWCISCPTIVGQAHRLFCGGACRFPGMTQDGQRKNDRPAPPQCNDKTCFQLIPGYFGFLIQGDSPRYFKATIGSSAGTARGHERPLIIIATNCVSPSHWARGTDPNDQGKCRERGFDRPEQKKRDKKQEKKRPQQIMK